MIFRSNQGTNLHLVKENRGINIKPYTSGRITCQVVSTPSVINGGHVIFKVKDGFGSILSVAVYQPTGLTKIASMLIIGDKIEVGYGAHLKSNDKLHLT